MDKDRDFSMFISYGHVLYCFFLSCLFPFESIRKNGKIKLTEKLAIQQKLATKAACKSVQATDGVKKPHHRGPGMVALC